VGGGGGGGVGVGLGGGGGRGGGGGGGGGGACVCVGVCARGVRNAEKKSMPGKRRKWLPPRFVQRQPRNLRRKPLLLLLLLQPPPQRPQATVRRQPQLGTGWWPQRSLKRVRYPILQAPMEHTTAATVARLGPVLVLVLVPRRGTGATTGTGATVAAADTAPIRIRMDTTTVRRGATDMIDVAGTAVGTAVGTIATRPHAPAARIGAATVGLVTAIDRSLGSMRTGVARLTLERLYSRLVPRPVRRLLCQHLPLRLHLHPRLL